MGTAYPDIDIPNTDIWELLFEGDNDFPTDKVIYLDPITTRSYSYAQVKQTATGFGSALVKRWNWRKGETLAIYANNSIDTPSVIWGTHYAGGIVSPANPAYNIEELANQLRACHARAVCTQLDLLPNARAAASAVGIDPSMIFLIGEGDDSLESGAVQHFSNMRMGDSQLVPRVRNDHPENDIAFLAFSSGTTGLPKAVKLTHRNVVASILMLEVAEKELTWDGGADGQGDTLVAFLPFYHILGLTTLVHLALYKGLRVIVMAKFALEDFCKIVQTYKASYVYVVPPIVLLLGKSPVVEKYDLSSIRMLTSAAAPLTKGLVEALWKKLSIKAKQGYGLTETCAGTHVQSWDDWNTSTGSVGRLLPNQRAKYVSAAGIEVPAGEVGELWLKGPNVFSGYLDDPISTANCFSNDGYFKTGDIGFQDAAGNFHITDRSKELIKYKGFQVAPAELEGILLGHDQVADACVVGIYDEGQATEIPVAWVVLQDPSSNSETVATAIQDWVSCKVSNHKKLRGGIRFVNEIPKSAAGKILRKTVREKISLAG